MERLESKDTSRISRGVRLVALAGSMIVLLATMLLGSSLGAPARAAAKGEVSAQDLQALFFVWDSGTPAVQQAAQQDCAQLALSAAQCTRLSDAVRAAWLDLAGRDPSATGRPSVAPNLSGRAQALSALGTQLDSITAGHTPQVLAATTTTDAQISSPRWIASHVTGAQALPAGTALVWATSYSQSSLPYGLNTRRSAYAALPDAYIKYANWGNISSIPSFYQPYYTPGGTQTRYTINIANSGGTKSVSRVPITDVGPWSEDDNWWDPNGTSTALQSDCPLPTTLAFPDATSNALVDGICPNSSAGGNLRRIYYYLLYQHDGLPFFQSSGYAPTGSFADGSAWPSALPQYCSEAAAASKNDDGLTCGGSGYNGNNGGWLRAGTYNAGVTNQSSVDLSPAVDKALGWAYPSSGLVQVTVGALP